MILSDVKQYLEQRQQASLQDLALRFDVEHEAMRGMLQFWINKGRIKKLENVSACEDACSCSQKQQRELYAWNAQFGKISIEIK